MAIAHSANSRIIPKSTPCKLHVPKWNRISAISTKNKESLLCAGSLSPKSRTGGVSAA
jgi:hypothetical protein